MEIIHMILTDSDKKIDARTLSNLETALKITLPQDYKTFLLKNNGGYVSEFLCSPDFIEVDPSNQKGYPQSTNVDRFYSLAEIIEAVADNKEDPVFPPCYIPIAYDSCGNMILLYIEKGETYGSIFFANHELYDKNGFYVITKISSSFSKFIWSLSPKERK